MKYLVFIISISIINTNILMSQPGGKGGVYIKNFYLSSKERMKINSEYKINFYILSGMDSLSDCITDLKFDPSKHRAYDKEQNKYILSEYYYLIFLSSRYPSQRALITNSIDTMVIDFIGVPLGNPAGMGYVDVDSIVFQPGYFCLFLKKSKNEFWRLTPDTLDALIKQNIIYYRRLNDYNTLVFCD